MSTVLNPQNVTVTLNPPNATQFRLKYLYAGAPVAEVVVSAVYVTASQYVQPLVALNNAVPGQYQGGSLVLTVAAINEGGESTAVAAPQEIEVINPPVAPADVEAA